jgi:hypothetical protein
MKQKTTSQDILQDIEFEIAQGMLSKEAFGPALKEVRQFQNRLRSQTFKAIKMNDPYREIISRQFQTTDMLLALLQEMAVRIQALQAAIENLRQHKTLLDIQPDESSSEVSSQAKPSLPLANDPGSAVQSTRALLSKHETRSQDEILNAMRAETITIPLQTRAIRWPLIGGLLTRLRIFYQRPAMHYTALLSERQAPVNRTLGDRILYLEGLLLEQQQQIEALKAKIPPASPENRAGSDQGG